MRGNSGGLWSNKNVNVKFTILQDSINGAEIYSEEHSTTTNVYGLLNLAIGSGTVLNGDFSTIPWGSSEHYLKFELDTTNGTNYYEMGISQLLSVPYALYSERTGDTTMWRKNQYGTLYYTEGKVGIGNAVADTNSLLHVSGIIRTDSAFKYKDQFGQSDTINQISAFDFTNDKLKYKTLIYAGGILSYISEESDWVDSIGGGIFPLPSFGQPCPGIPTVSYEGQTYNTTLIGNQCWLKENLNVGTKINSTTGGQQQTNNGVIEKYCYDNDITQCDIYGGLYEWNESMQYVTSPGTQGICPPGWHIPTDAEWTTLGNFLGGSLFAGGKMKETGYAHWYSPNTGATNESGFTGLPGGYRDYFLGFFDTRNLFGDFWTSSTFDYSESAAWIYRLSYNYAIMNGGYHLKTSGLSVRCLQDD